jgi:hypothetical protein
MARKAQKTNRGKRWILVAFMILLAEGVTAEPASAQEMMSKQTAEQTGSLDTTDMGTRTIDIRSQMPDRVMDIGPEALPIIQRDNGQEMAASVPARAQRFAGGLSWASQSQAVPHIGLLSPVLGEPDGYVGLSWRF